MEISIKNVDRVTVIDLAGEIDGKSAPLAQQQIVPTLQSGAKLLLDMSKVPYMSSAGLRLMLLLYRQMANLNGSIALVGLSDEIRDTMEATGFLGYFTTCATVDEALAALQAGEAPA